MRLRFPESQIQHYADTYSYPRQETELLGLRSTVQSAGFMTKQQLGFVARWKSPRSAGRIETNTEAYVEEVTAFALGSRDERARIESLTLLDGVRWPTASAVLHLFHRDPYPILDFRALWSVQTDVPREYTFEFWQEYVGFCREVAQRALITMRVLDRALWQYSKENQPENSV